MYEVAIVHEDRKDVRNSLCKELVCLIRKSGDAQLLNGTKAKLLGDDLVEIFSGISADSAIPAMCFASPDWEVFVKQALSDPVPSSGDMALCQSLLKTIDLDAWENIVAPAVVLKLKAKPETVLDMAEGLFRYIPADVIVQSSVVRDDSLPVLMKHINTQKE